MQVEDYSLQKEKQAHLQRGSSRKTGRHSRLRERTVNELTCGQGDSVRYFKDLGILSKIGSSLEGFK